MDVAGLARTLDEYLGQSVESIDGKGSGGGICRPLCGAESRVAVSAAQDAPRTFDREVHGQAGRRDEISPGIQNGKGHDSQVAAVRTNISTVGGRVQRGGRTGRPDGLVHHFPAVLVTDRTDAARLIDGFISSLENDK